MSYPEICPEVPNTYPRKGACLIPIDQAILPDDTWLEIWAWSLDFSNRSSISVPAIGANCAYILVRWSGNLTIGGTPIDGCCGLEQGAQLIQGDVDLFGDVNTKAFLIVYAALGGPAPLVQEDWLIGRGKIALGRNRNLSAGTVIKVLQLDDPNQPTACFATWNYGSVVIFDETSPRIFYRATETSTPHVTNPDQFDVLGLNQAGLVAFERRDDSQANVVVLLDFDDPSDAGTEGGCSYRCFGGGLNEDCAVSQ